MIRIWYTNTDTFINFMMGIGKKPTIANLSETHKVVWENLETKIEAQPL